MKSLLQFSCVVVALSLTGIARADSAGEIIEASGVRGGLIVRLGCGEGQLIAELAGEGPFMVHGLDGDEEKVAAAREYIRKKNLGAKASVSKWTGERLPYAENMVNLIVADSVPAVSADEMMRVLVPGGVACIKKDGKWTNAVKPWPKEIDEWTHFLYDASGNAVSHDDVVGPPRRFQWMAKPLWSRHHNTVPSISAMVSSEGRIFYIVDEAPAAADGEMPDKWTLIARDAFNGLPLWRIPIYDWGWKAWSSYWEARFNQPNHVAKRLVAAGDRVYATLGFNSPLTAIDAATGKIVKTYPDTEYTDEILYQNGTLILSVNEAPQSPGTVDEKPPVKKHVCAIDADSGKVLWKSARYTGISTKTGPIERETHLMLAAKGDCVVLVNKEQIVGLDRTTGKELWTTPRPTVKEYTSRYAHMMSEMATLVATDKVVLFCQLEPIQKRIGWRVIKARIRAYSAETGKPLWDYPCGNWGHFCVPDVFVAQGLVWVHDKESMSAAGLDLQSGEEKRRISTELAFDNGHHHRCYRNKATDKFMVTSFRGLEFIDWDADTINLNHWVRGACRYGVMPANGMVYSTPHPCDCYMNSKLNGIYALGPAVAGAKDGTPRPDETSSPRFEKGPAYASVQKVAEVESHANVWPAYRGGATRSGKASGAIGAKLDEAWQRHIPGPITAPVAADGRVLLVSNAENALYSLDAADGSALWRFTLDGPADTPPTIYEGLVLQGCRDGWVYCLRISDGQLAWRFRAAPATRLVGALGRIESAWPVHGSVLVQNGKAYVTAGRSSFLDGGIYAYELDVRSGKVLDQRRIDSEQSMKVYYGRNQSLDTGSRNDILVGDGERVFMRRYCIFGDDSNLEGVCPQLHATAGMLDDSWFNRMFWTIDDKAHGQLLVHDDETVYTIRGFHNRAQHVFFSAGKDGFELAAVDRKPAKGDNPVKRDDRSNINWNWKTPKESKWSVRVPVRVKAMALAGETLLAAGAPDLVDPAEPWAAYEGKRGGVLLAVSTEDGKTLARYELSAPPVLDGIAVADGKLYVSTKDGKTTCLKESEPQP